MKGAEICGGLLCLYIEDKDFWAVFDGQLLMIE